MNEKKPLPGSLGGEREDKPPLEERVAVTVAIIFVIWALAMLLIIGTAKLLVWALQ